MPSQWEHIACFPCSYPEHILQQALTDRDASMMTNVAQHVYAVVNTLCEHLETDTDSI